MTQNWWREAVIYQIYPRSFSDADGDGMGDLPGITARLPHLRTLGVDAIWLSPFYVSPQADAGYDVADYRDIDPRFGSLADADTMITTAHSLDLRVLVDLVPNHTSDDHAWFRQALAAAPGSPERDRYLFRDGAGTGGDEPPNNWRSVFGGPAWTRVADPSGEPGQWYLHLFDVRQPDLNWQNADVRAEFESVLRFWLERGVDGFRVDVASGLVKADGLPGWDGPAEMLHGEDEHGRRPPMWDQDGVHEIYRDWRKVLDSYDGERILVAEAWVDPPERLARYVRPDEMHQAFNFDYLLAKWTATEQREAITHSLAAYGEVGAASTWVLSNHDVLRHTTRFGFPPETTLPRGIGADDPQPDQRLGLRRARAATLLMLALPGAAYLYQGEELGLPDVTTLPDDVRQDPTWLRSGHTERGRDGCRVPIPWSGDAPSYGFGPGEASWLPQPDSWARYSAEAQEGVTGSTLSMYRAALRLRREHRLGAGDLAWLDGYGPDVVAFANSGIAVIANIGTAGAGSVDLPEGELLLASADVDRDGRLPADTTAWVRISEA